MAPFSNLVDATGRIRLYRQHLLSGLISTKWIVLTEYGPVIFSCRGAGEDYEILGEDIGSTPNLLLIDLIRYWATKSISKINSAEIGQRESEIMRSILLFIDHFLEMTGIKILNCKSDYSNSVFFCSELESSFYAISNGMPATLEVQRLAPMIRNLNCVEKFAA